MMLRTHHRLTLLITLTAATIVALALVVHHLWPAG
jgi:hypothetical protein